MTITLYDGDCLEILPTLEAGSIDAIIVACVQTGRNFVGIEINEEYCNIAEERIKKALAEMEH